MFAKEYCGMSNKNHLICTVTTAAEAVHVVIVQVVATVGYMNGSKHNFSVIIHL